ncbi:hypothetical protein EDC04DRAFT_2897105 [Pisolithus marmoratus]|nr:hypothetical protein EDC04DRAFT_2897105 [Pisolithus marmoratus]
MAKFQWENREQFISLVNILSLRNGSQLRLNDDEENEEVEVDVDILGSKAFIWNSKGNELKQHLLDSFAEIMSRDKGGKHVCCVALHESGDWSRDVDAKISLFVARNTAFKDRDKKFCSTVSELLSTVGASLHDKARDLSVVKEKLWEELVRYNQPRIDRYAGSLRGDLRAFKNAGSLENIPPYSTESQSRVAATRNLSLSATTLFAHGRILELDDILCSNNRAARRRPLVQRAYAIRRMKSLRILIGSCSKASIGRKLLKDIQFLGRLESCFHTLIEAAPRIPGFSQLSIIPKETEYAKAEERFSQLQSKVSRKSLHTHAELQLLFSITKTTDCQIMNGEIYPYIGCSKSSCFLCAVFMKCFTPDGVTFRTRGCHGKIYTQWSISDMDGLEDDMVKALGSALKRMQDDLRNEIMKPIASTTHLPESSADVTDDTGDTDDTDDTDETKTC